MSDEKHIQYEDCIVTFIDVLGFRSLVMDRSAADVHRVIKRLEEFTRPENVQDYGLDSKTISHAYAQSVSDAIVRVRPYHTKYRDGAFFREILDLLHAQMELVNLGVLIRAGLTVGKAYVPLSGDGPVFGPAMIRAYEIESQEAVYPRIVIDDDALEQHKLDPRLRSDNNSLAEELAHLDRMLAIGDDGIKYIDYLGAFGEFDSESGYFEFLQSHANLIRNGRSENKPRGVKRKYEWLAAYHNRRVDSIKESVLSSEAQRRAFYEECEVPPEDFLEEITV